MSATKPARRSRWSTWCLDTTESIEATTALPEPKLMSLSELVVTWGNYERRISAHLHGHGDGLSEDEKAHALACEEAYGEYEDARR